MNLVLRNRQKSNLKPPMLLFINPSAAVATLFVSDIIVLCFVGSQKHCLIHCCHHIDGNTFPIASSDISFIYSVISGCNYLWRVLTSATDKSQACSAKRQLRQLVPLSLLQWGNGHKLVKPAELPRQTTKQTIHSPHSHFHMRVIKKYSSNFSWRPDYCCPYLNFFSFWFTKTTSYSLDRDKQNRRKR